MKDGFVDFFRATAPYVHAHRGRTFVIAFGGEAVQSRGFSDLVHDLALLHGLGVRLVLVHGARPQIEARLAESGGKIAYVDGRRVTDDDALDCVKAAVGAVRVEVEGRLSMGVANSPMAGARIRVASGNFVQARPVGVVNGVDHRHTGEVRKIDVEGIRQRLDAGAIVLLSPLGYSITGDVFNIGADEIAAAAAGALEADKLVALVEGDLDLPRELSPDEADAALEASEFGPHPRRFVGAATDACRMGVRRAHLVRRAADGGLLWELFTRDGVGSMITTEAYERVRPARSRDVGGLLRLIRPLEARGLLVKRPRKLLERDIHRFLVVERDGMIIACAALHLWPDDAIGEMACVAVHPDYRDGGRGDRLLDAVERRARAEGLSRLFALTTRSPDWFRERGFVPGTLEDLPQARRASYDPSRNSLICVKAIG